MLTKGNETMNSSLDIPINADVHCTDGLFGQTACVIIHPITKEITHVVVKSKSMPYPEYLVPVELIDQTTPEAIDLNCSRAKLVTLDEFVEHEFVRIAVPMAEYPPDEFALWPYVLPQEEKFVDIVHERIPIGELALHRGAEVQAVDGPVGHLDEFLVQPGDGHITHLVLRHGHLWGKKDVVVPVSAIEKIVADTVYLKMTQDKIAAMPAVPVKRWWH